MRPKEAGIMLRRGIALSVFFTVMLFAAFAPSAGASHNGAIADCGTAGTFTVKATPNNGGFQSPAPDKLILFEEGAVLTVQQLSVDGELIFTRAATGSQHNAITQVTCSFTIGAGSTFVVTGILAAA
jgi:hypothetical protein